jgi:hypothetical protein
MESTPRRCGSSTAQNEASILGDEQIVSYFCIKFQTSIQEIVSIKSIKIGVTDLEMRSNALNTGMTAGPVSIISS